MLKLVVFSALVAVATPAVYPGFNNLRSYPTRPPIVPLPLPVYKPQPSYAPQTLGRQIAILRLESDIAPDGSQYQYAYDTENGISAQESGALVGSGADAGVASSGSYSYTSPEGVPVQISYTADENGFQPSGNVLPTPPPIPEAILRSIEYNAAHPEPNSAVVPIQRRYY